MQFQITITKDGQQILMTVRRAVYFDKIVFQVSTDSLKAIVYQKGYKWQSVNNTLLDQDLLDKIGNAILQTVGDERLD
jgi:hypothetical protein